MRIEIATLFPEMCEAYLSESIIGRARKSGTIEVHCHNIRDYTLDKHRRVDDKPAYHLYVSAGADAHAEACR